MNPARANVGFRMKLQDIYRNVL